MNFKITADSSSNIFFLPDIPYCHVPLKVITQQAEYVDDPGLDIAAMVQELSETKGPTGTSCPNPNDWLTAFGDSKNIFSVTITSNLSGCYNAAVAAKEEYLQENPDANICIIDSLSTGPEMRLLIEKLSDGIKEKKDFAQLEQEIKEYQSHTHLLFCLQSLMNLARNGRVNPAIAKFAAALGVRVIGAASPIGTLEPLHKRRGEKKALDTMLNEMIDRGYKGGKVRIAHCLNENAALQMQEKILLLYPNADIAIEPCTALCSFYAEKGGLIIGYEDL